MAALKRLWAPGLSTLLFAIPAILIARQLGIEADEALVTAGIFPGLQPVYSLHFGSAELPLMLLTYVGTLRTWLYNALFLIWEPSAMVLRAPMILIGVATLWVFWALANRMAGKTAAIAAVLLLATDPSWLLLEAIDFGYVAVQHLLKLAGMYLVLRFAETGRARALFGGFFLFGVALWDKAVFLWVLAGLFVAVVFVFPREARKLTTWRTLAFAAAGLLAGAAPWIVYNIARPLETFRANARVGAEDWGQKARILRGTMDGSLLFGVFTGPDAGVNARPPHRTLHYPTFALARLTGRRQAQVTLVAAVLALLALPLVWRNRAVQFSWVFSIATWLAMLVSTGGGLGAHHAILLWPFHLVAIAATGVALAAREPREVFSKVMTGAFVALLAMNLLVVNEYYVDAVRNGPGPRWTDAIEPLYGAVSRSRAPFVFVSDWGILETLVLLSEGTLPLQGAIWLPQEAADAGLQQRADWMLAQPEHVFVSHTREKGIFTGSRDLLDRRAAARGYTREDLKTIYDRNGRPTFDLFRYRRVR